MQPHLWPLVRSAAALVPRVPVEVLAPPKASSEDTDAEPPARDADEWDGPKPRKEGTRSRPSAKRWGERVPRAS